MRPVARPRRKARRPTAWAALLLAAWVLLPAAAWGQGEEILLLRVVVDGRAFGIMDLRVSPEGELLISLENLDKLGLRGLPVFRARAVGGEAYLAVNDLYPRVESNLDRLASTLYLTVRDRPPPEPPKRRGVRTFEPAIVTVTLNGAPVGERIVQLTSAGHVLMSLDDLRGLGVAHLLPGTLQFVEGRRHVALDDLDPWLTYDLSERAASLAITVDPGHLATTVVSLSPRPHAGTERLSAAGAVLNYALDYQAGEGGRFEALSAPLELGARIAGGFAFTDALYTRTEGAPDTVDRLVREESHLTFDDERRLVRYRLGDAAAGADPLGGSVRLAGLSVSREFSISPLFIRYPGLALAGTLRTPSEVSVYANGMLVQRERLPAGDFTFEDLFPATGAGVTELVIRDAFGREEHIASTYYISPRLLRAGLSSFSYRVGARRKAFGTNDADYGSPVWSAFHRIGVAPWLTLGARAEADGDVTDGGPDVSLVLGQAGEVDLAYAASRTHARKGSAWRAGYAYTGRGFTMRLAATGRSREYATLSLAADADKAEEEGVATASAALPGVGSLSLSYAVTRFHVAVEQTRVSLFFSRPLDRAITLFLRADHIEQIDSEDEAFVGVTRYLGTRHTAALDVQTREEASTTHASFVRYTPAGLGWGYRMEGTRTDPAGDLDARQDGDGYLEYHGPWGIYRAEARAGNDTERYRASTAGALAWTGGAAFASRPVRDGFAVVQVPGVEGVNVYHENRLEARTDRRGLAFVPDLTSYVDNRITIDARGVPFGYDVRGDARRVTVPYRGIGAVDFPVTRMQAFVGRLFMARGGRRAPIELAWMTVGQGPQAQRVPVGRGGEFYLEGLPPGRHRASVAWKETGCRFIIDIPESPDVLVDLGEVVCEPN